jgi:hypothetical protein
MRSLFPDEYDFYPRTWFLPEQSQQFQDDIRYIHQQDTEQHRSLTTFIVKPSGRLLFAWIQWLILNMILGGSQGQGIYLLRNPMHVIKTNRSHVIQGESRSDIYSCWHVFSVHLEYIDRPLLIQDLKFDLRIYVLILNLSPLEVFLYDEGLVRFATVEYQQPSSDNLHQICMHLTNYSLNKHSSNYKHTINEQEMNGSKRKLSHVWQQLQKSYGSIKVEQAKVLITDMIDKTILAITPELRVEYEYQLPSAKKYDLSCFQVKSMN